MNGFPNEIGSMRSAGGLAEESRTYVLIHGDLHEDFRGLYALTLSNFQWTRIPTLGIPRLLFPSAVVVGNRLFLVGGQAGEKAGCCSFPLEDRRAVAASRSHLLTYPPLDFGQLTGNSGKEGLELQSAATRYRAETGTIFVSGGRDNKFVCEIDVGHIR